MIGIVLAAGYGNRMRPLTNDKHKTLLNVGDNTILNNIMMSFSSNNILDVYIVTGYRNLEIQEYVTGRYPTINVKYIDNPDYLVTNNIHSLALALQEIDVTDDIVLIESDLFYESKIITDLIDSPYPNIALIDKYRSGMDGTVVRVEKEKICDELIRVPAIDTRSCEGAGLSHQKCIKIAKHILQNTILLIHDQNTLIFEMRTLTYT